MENKTDKELMDWYLRHPDEREEERRVFLGLYGHKRKAMASSYIDQLAAAEEGRRRRRLWPYGVALAAAACLLLVLLPRGTEPAPMAQAVPVEPAEEAIEATDYEEIAPQAEPRRRLPLRKKEVRPAVEVCEGLPYDYCCAELPDSLVRLGEGELIFTI